MNEIEFFDAVFTSSATPKFFTQAEFNGKKYQDGGDGDIDFNNNNPTYSLIAEAIQQGYSLENINVISLGTGHYDTTNDPENEHALFWEPSYTTSIAKSTENTHKKVEKLFENNPGNYVRF